ncbi:MAG: hypothetical protein ACQCXQ_08965 [Verrucomicrobiales bacterium]|nr:hypothetical protein [Verrucomicrobiota bacterium JB025]
MTTTPSHPPAGTPPAPTTAIDLTTEILNRPSHPPAPISQPAHPRMRSFIQSADPAPTTTLQASKP